MGAQMGQQNMFSGQTTDSSYNGGTSHFELTLYSDGKIKFQYKVSRTIIAEFGLRCSCSLSNERARRT